SSRPSTSCWKPSRTSARTWRTSSRASSSRIPEAPGMAVTQASLWFVVMLVAVALLFDFMNGFHDAANSIATVVSTGVLKPTQAVLFAAVFNVVALFIFHLSVAATIGKGIVEPGVVDVHVVF